MQIYKKQDIFTDLRQTLKVPLGKFQFLHNPFALTFNYTYPKIKPVNNQT
jgi:hypothetical protein